MILFILDLLRKHPDVIQEFLPLLEPAINVIGNNPKGLASLIWILGEFGEYMEVSPYVLENLIENNSENSTEVVHALLLSACKLFFKTPGEMQGILGRLFEFIFKNFNDVDLKERAGHFYSLMQNNIEEAEYVICNEKATVEAFYSELDSENTDKVFDEFNTLSVLYQKPGEKFLKQYLDVEQIEKKDQDLEQDQDQEEEIKEEKEEPICMEVPEYSKETLSAKAILNDDEYQRLWSEFTYELSEEKGPIPEEIDYEEFVKYLESELLFVKAYNESNSTLRMYLYSKDVRYIFTLEP